MRSHFVLQCMVNVLKFQTLFLFLFSNKMLVIRAGIHKMHVRKANRKTLIRLLLKKQSDLSALSRLYL